MFLYRWRIFFSFSSIRLRLKYQQYISANTIIITIVQCKEFSTYLIRNPYLVIQDISIVVQDMWYKRLRSLQKTFSFEYISCNIIQPKEISLYRFIQKLQSKWTRHKCMELIFSIPFNKPYLAFRPYRTLKHNPNSKLLWCHYFSRQLIWYKTTSLHSLIVRQWPYNIFKTCFF